MHTKAEEARESGDFLKALEFTDQAILAYEKDNDLLGLSEVLSSRQSTFKHLYRKTGNKAFLTLERFAAAASVEIAKESGVKEAIGIPYHNLGKYYFEAKEYKKAAGFFKKAVENLTSHPSTRHSRPSVLADIKGHLLAAQYHADDKTALARAIKTLEELKNSQEKSTYNKNVWLSGGHLRIAEMLAQDDKNLAIKHAKKAEQIIESDKRLILRKKQLEDLRKILISKTH